MSHYASGSNTLQRSGLESSDDADLPYSKLAKMKKRALYCTIAIVTCFILASLFGGVVVWWLSYGSDNTVSADPIYAAAGDIVVVSKITDKVALVWYSITECLISPEDFSHPNQLYLIPDTLNHHIKSDHINFTEPFNQSERVCISSVLPDPLYMLEGSSIEIEICISSDSEPNGQGTFLILDNNKVYQQFISDGDCEPTSIAAFAHNLNIGSFGHFECNTVSYTTETNGYLYAVPIIPGRVQYYYRYSYIQFSFAQNDLGNLLCTFSSEDNNYCPIGFVPRTPMHLVVYVKPITEGHSNSTHLCFRSDWSHGLIVLAVAFSLPVLVLLPAGVVFSVCLCCIYHKYKTNKTKLPPLVQL